MSKTIIMIPAASVQLGMYVSKLDRDWLDTNFLFQGFYIRTDEDIQRIKATCDHVYVDTEQHLEGKHYVIPCTDNESSKHQKILTEPADAARVEKPKLKTTALSASAAAISASPTRIVNRVWSICRSLRPKTSLTKELKRARNVYDTAQSTVSQIMDALRIGGELDIAAVKQVVSPMIHSVLRNPDAMACIVSMKKKDDYLYNHALATSVWVLVFGRHLGFSKSELQVLATAGMLLDIGKTRIPSELLQKATPLSKKEIEELQRHVEYGVEILKVATNIDPRVEAIIKTHHERHDGSGYPHGLSGTDIPVFGRIVGIVDTYDAMTSSLPYAAAMSTYDAMRQLLQNADILFQSEIVERFIQVVGMFPTGTLIELNTGEVGIVIQQNSVRRLRPKIMLILDSEKTRRNDFPSIDLKKLPSNASDPNAVWISHGLDYGSYGIDPASYYL